MTIPDVPVGRANNLHFLMEARWYIFW